MKFIACLLFTVVCLSLLEDISTQDARFRHLVYYPPSTRTPRPVRVRRQAVHGSLASNPKGGADATLQIAKGIGTPDHNLIGSAFASGNTNGGPATMGGGVNYNNNGHGLGLSASHTPGVVDTFSQTAHANLFKNDKHSLDANAFASQSKFANGFKAERNGVGLDYNHANGHNLGLTHSNIPNFGRQLELGGNMNLWRSRNENTRLDLNGRGSQWLSGPLRGQRDYGFGLGLKHNFK